MSSNLGNSKLIKRTSILLGIFVLANILTTLKIVTDNKFFNSSDFIAYSIGAKMVKDGHGKNLYDLKLQTQYWDDFLANYGMSRASPYILPYLAPPLTAVLYIPYLYLPSNMRAPVAMIVSAGLILLGAIILGKATSNLKFSLLMVFSSWFVFVCIWQIQPTAYLFLTTALLYWSLTKEKYGLAGILCAVFILKPQYLLIAPLIFILTNKSWTFVRFFLITLAVLLGLNLVISGPQNLFVDYPKFLAFTNNPNYGNRWYEMYSVQHLLYTITRHITASEIPGIVVGAVLYIWGARKTSKLAAKVGPRSLVPPVLILISLTSYHVLTQDICIILPAFVGALTNPIIISNTKQVKIILTTVVVGYFTSRFYFANLYALILIFLLYSQFNLYEQTKNLPTE